MIRPVGAAGNCRKKQRVVWVRDRDKISHCNRDIAVETSSRQDMESLSLCTPFSAKLSYSAHPLIGNSYFERDSNPPGGMGVE